MIAIVLEYKISPFVYILHQNQMSPQAKDIFLLFYRFSKEGGV